MRKLRSRPPLRFLIAGGLNSAASYLLYLALLRLLPYAWSYSLSYLAGILLSFVLTSRYVFRVPLRWSKLIQFPIVYLVQYLLGMGVLALLVGALGLDPRLGPLGVLLVTVPVSFGMSRWILRPRKAADRAEVVETGGGEEPGDG